MTRKEELKKLARDIKFESKIFADEFGHSSKEPLRYYLWMCELQKWLRDVHNIHIDIVLTIIDSEKGWGYGVSVTKFEFVNDDMVMIDLFNDYADTYEEILEIGLTELLKLI